MRHFGLIFSLTLIPSCASLEKMKAMTNTTLVKEDSENKAPRKNVSLKQFFTGGPDVDQLDGDELRKYLGKSAKAGEYEIYVIPQTLPLIIADAESQAEKYVESDVEKAKKIADWKKLFIEKKTCVYVEAKTMDIKTAKASNFVIRSVSESENIELKPINRVDSPEYKVTSVFGQTFTTWTNGFYACSKKPISADNGLNLLVIPREDDVRLEFRWPETVAIPD